MHWRKRLLLNHRLRLGFLNWTSVPHSTTVSVLHSTLNTGNPIFKETKASYCTALANCLLFNLNVSRILYSVQYTVTAFCGTWYRNFRWQWVLFCSYPMYCILYCSTCQLQAKRRHTVKLPPPRARTGKPRCTGLQYTEDGEPYISMWPGDRPSAVLTAVPRQSVEEAAKWPLKVGVTVLHGHRGITVLYCTFCHCWGVPRGSMGRENRKHFRWDFGAILCPSETCWNLVLYCNACCNTVTSPSSKNMKEFTLLSSTWVWSLTDPGKAVPKAVEIAKANSDQPILGSGQSLKVSSGFSGLLGWLFLSVL